MNWVPYPLWRSRRKLSSKGCSRIETRLWRTGTRTTNLMWRAWTKTATTFWVTRSTEKVPKVQAGCPTHARPDVDFFLDNKPSTSANLPYLSSLLLNLPLPSSHRITAIRLVPWNPKIGMFYIVSGYNHDKRWKRSDEYVVGGATGHVQYLKEGGAYDDEQEDAEQPWTYLRGLFLFLAEYDSTWGRSDLSRLAFWCFLLLRRIYWSLAMVV